MVLNAVQAKDGDVLEYPCHGVDVGGALSREGAVGTEEVDQVAGGGSCAVRHAGILLQEGLQLRPVYHLVIFTLIEKIV